MDKIAELENKLKNLDSKLDANRKAAAPSNTPSKEDVFGYSNGAPAVRRGETSMGSRGFSFIKMMGLVAGVIDPDDAKVEADVTARLHKQYKDSGFIKHFGGGRKTWLAPLGADYMVSDETLSVPQEFRDEMKSLCHAGVGNVDPDEIKWQLGKSYGMKAAQSWIDQTLGGSLVAPPAFGELIQLLRNKDALINAGARVEALPPQGRLELPRQTTPTTGYYVGENSPTTVSNFGTGKLVLSAKKVAALVELPNELIRFASPASEAILRADMTKTLSLTMDYQLLYGEGSDVYPLGLINTPNIVSITASDSSGAALAPQDFYQFPAQIEANNGEMQGYICRPEMFYNFVSARAAVYNGSGTVQQGQYVFDQFRQLGMGFKKELGGYPCTTTSQVSITRGASSNQTSLFGGQWDDYIIAMFGSIEFAQATQGDTAFANDQTVVRAILTHDGAPRHPGVFAVCDPVNLTLGS